MLRRLSFYLLPALLLTFVLSDSTLAQSEKKTVFGILLDNTNSLEKRFPQVLMFSKEAVKRIHQRGPISLFSFVQGQRTRWGSLLVVSSNAEWSQDESVLSDYIDDISIVTGRQADLYDAVSSMARVVSSKADSAREVYGDKIIILITSGQDSLQREVEGMVIKSQDTQDNNRKAKNQVIKLLKESGIKVYAIGFTQELSTDTSYGRYSSPREEAEEFLRKITKETGGRVVFPKSKKINVGDVDNVLNELFAQ